MAVKPAALSKRAGTALIGGLLLAITILYLPLWVFHLLTFMLGLAGIREYARLVEGYDLSVVRTPMVITLVYGILALYWQQLNLLYLPYLVVTLTALLALLPLSDVKLSLQRAGVTLTGCAYLGFSLVGLSWLISLDSANIQGRLLVVLCILLIWLGDSAAYLVGSMLGKHKVAPTISPGKTVEGTVANFFGCLLAVLVARSWFLPQLTWLDALVLTCMFGILGFLGDLTESAWKRGSNIKDSGSLFPGHGGILDRLDSVYLTVPIFYLYARHFLL